MPDLKALYGTPVELVPAIDTVNPIYEFDLDSDFEEGSHFHPARPDYAVDARQSLFLVAPRAEMLRLLREQAHALTRVTATNGVLDISVRAGSRSVEKNARIALGAVKGAAKVVFNPMSLRKNQLVDAKSLMKRAISDEKKKLDNAVIQISDINRPGLVRRASNSTFRLNHIADLLERRHGF